jgi:hypothetical protein
MRNPALSEQRFQGLGFFPAADEGEPRASQVIRELDVLRQEMAT